MQMNAERERPFEFHILGDVHHDFDVEKYGAVVHGEYSREGLAAFLVEIAPTFSLIPSICAETFCHTLTESWAAGIPAFATDIGALGERIRRYGGGWLLDVEHPEGWFDAMLKVVNSPEDYNRRREELEQMKLTTVQEMADHYLVLYEQLLNHSDVPPITAPVQTS